MEKHIFQAPSPSARAHRNILVIEDHPDTAEALEVLFSGEGYGVRSVASRDDALVVLDSYIYDVIIMDFNMEGLGPDEFLRQSRVRCPHSNYVLITGEQNGSLLAKKLGIAKWL